MQTFNAAAGIAKLSGNVPNVRLMPVARRQTGNQANGCDSGYTPRIVTHLRSRRINIPEQIRARNEFVASDNEAATHQLWKKPIRCEGERLGSKHSSLHWVDVKDSPMRAWCSKSAYVPSSHRETETLGSLHRAQGRNCGARRAL